MHIQLERLILSFIFLSIVSFYDISAVLAAPLAVIYKGEPSGLAKESIEFLYNREAQKIIIASGFAPAKTDNQEQAYGQYNV